MTKQSSYFNKITFVVYNSKEIEYLKNLINNTGADHYTHICNSIQKYDPRDPYISDEQLFIVFPKSKEDKILIELALHGQVNDIERIDSNTRRKKAEYYD